MSSRPSFKRDMTWGIALLSPTPPPGFEDITLPWWLYDRHSFCSAWPQAGLWSTWSSILDFYMTPGILLWALGTLEGSRDFLHPSNTGNSTWNPVCMCVPTAVSCTWPLKASTLLGTTQQRERRIPLSHSTLEDLGHMNHPASHLLRLEILGLAINRELDRVAIFFVFVWPIHWLWPVPSFRGILYTWIRWWGVWVSEGSLWTTEKMEPAQKRGSQAHIWIQVYIKSLLGDLSKSLHFFQNSFLLCDNGEKGAWEALKDGRCEGWEHRLLHNFLINISYHAFPSCWGLLIGRRNKMWWKCC